MSAETGDTMPKKPQLAAARILVVFMITPHVATIQRINNITKMATHDKRARDLDHNFPCALDFAAIGKRSPKTRRFTLSTLARRIPTRSTCLRLDLPAGLAPGLPPRRSFESTYHK
jgi:site-specific recombinase